MQKINLAGPWELMIDQKDHLDGQLPGCQYLDLIRGGMDDPFYGTNENEATEKGHHAHEYSRTFSLSKADISHRHLDFTGDGIDTIAHVFVNGKEAGYANNFHRVWRFDIKDLVEEGENELKISIQDPYAYMLSEQKKDMLLIKPGKEKAFIRKPPCHFGWDWGPKLAPSGVARSLYLEAYDARILETKILQHHENGKVRLSLELIPDAFEQGQKAEVILAIDGTKQTVELQETDGIFTGFIDVDEPKLWWPNGLGAQPLYDLTYVLKQNDEIQDEVHKKIGLRTLVLDTAKDQDGEQFRFVVNEVPIYVKGADWIPADSFITRATREDIEYYAKAAQKAGMNMFRVWGGGMYESEDFYDMCDRYGILVWQDFIFACELYPFWNKEFLQNVRKEVEDNVKRLRHRASLALWCGNNEIDALYPVCRNKTIHDANKNFFYLTLRDWTKELDTVTPYWPGSPSSGHIDKGIQNFRKGKVSGDSHLWNIWHGMLPIEKFRSFPTRFCSEFGMESMPAMKTIRRINPNPKPDLFDDVMLLHQKSGGGNSKIMYYLLQKYRNPAEFEDFVYLSQINQSNAMRYATECWKRNMGRQNGAIMWQMNDCWPVASWSIIDYDKQYKATLYHARHFNRTQMISNDYYDNKSDLYVINELPEPLSAELDVEIADFSGKVVRHEKRLIEIDQTESQKVLTLSYKGMNKKDLFIKAALCKDGEVLDEKSYLLVPDKEATLPNADIKKNVSIQNGIASVTLESDLYARYVFVDSDLTQENWSDNYMDLLPGKAITITVPVPEDVTEEAFEDSLRIKSLTDVKPAGTLKDDKKTMKQMWKKDNNWATYYAYKLVMLILWYKSIGD